MTHGDDTVINAVAEVGYRYCCLPITAGINADEVMGLGDHAQNTTNPAISLVVYNVIPLLICLLLLPNMSIMYKVGEGTRSCPVTGNGHGRVPSPT